ncbi:MAG TPA: xanthine dehydrogenase family protein molybdopterin-binding subunit [Chthonomonadaceae bacterium]|nr:xanthine dehydrogenase family protein molybdopterin-binding subunit [Chthonomonadaceae bacterium]
MAQQQKPKMKKIKTVKDVNGVPTEVEIEVPDTGGPTWGPRGSHTLLNHDIERVDGPAKATGAAKYTYDVRVPGMLYGRVLMSPHACADITSVDTSAAEAMPGVKAVVTLNDKQVKYEGDPVAAVAAITPEIAEDAVRTIKVAYKKRPHAVTYQQATKAGAPAVYQNAPDNVRKQGGSGDRAKAEAALMTADATVEREFVIGMQHHACLETHGVMVDYTGGDTATVYASTQGTFTIPNDAAGALGMKVEKITAIVEYMGGGFGSKFGIDLPGQIACRLSKKANAPVRLMLSRPQEFLAAGNRNGALQRVKAGASKDGKLVAMVAEQYDLGGLGEGGLAGLPYIYHVPTVYQESNSLHTNQDSSRAMRGPGHPQTSFAMESIMDDLAAKIGMDPIEFRKANTGDAFYHRQLDTAAKEIGWERRPKTPGGGTVYGPYKSLKRGMGCGAATWGGGGRPECQVDVFVKQDGSIAVQVGTQDLGTGSRTYTAAIVAEEMGLPVKAVETRIGNSKYGQANASGGSTTTASLAPAVKVAAVNAKGLLFAAAAPMLGVKPEELSAANGKLFVTADPNKSMTWKQACATLGAAGISARGEWSSELAGNGVHGVQMAEVEVDTETGHVRVLKMVGVQDCGLALNRRAVQSQLNGGMIQGLGYALLEEHWVDEATGCMLNPSLEEYKLPGAMDMPEMVSLIDDGDTREVVIGMAEPAAIPGASAIANAVFNACGARITSLPITPDKVLTALNAKA